VGLALIGSAVGAAIFLPIEADPPDLVQPVGQLPPGAIELDTPAGQQLLFESDARASFTSLMSHLTTQVIQIYCAVASISMVLNALKVPSPISQGHGIHQLFTQTNLLNEMTDFITTQRKVARNGMGLKTLAELLKA